MGKNDFMSPKAIANRIKAKGLLKLRWYCQMCGKSCRDENGFKCHLSSESHRRQMEIFGQAPDKVVDEFSEQFESTFLEHLRRAHPHSRVAANVVYNEFIADRHHIHMNSTKWFTLTDFVKDLGKRGICRVEETPKGWYMSLIQRDPNEELAERKRQRREKAALEEEQRRARELEEQIARAQANHRAAEEAVQSEGDVADILSSRDAPLAFSLAAPARQAEAAAQPRPALRLDEEPEAGAPAVPPRVGEKRSKLEEIMAKDMLAKQHAPTRLAGTGTGGSRTAQPSAGRKTAPWVCDGIIVKIMSPALKSAGYYKQKGAVTRVIDGYVAEIELLDSGDVVRVDQEELETVIPAEGGAVLVLQGRHAGKRGTLQTLDTSAFSALVRLRGEDEPRRFEYEDISKLAR